MPEGLSVTQPRVKRRSRRPAARTYSTMKQQVMACEPDFTYCEQHPAVESYRMLCGKLLGRETPPPCFLFFFHSFYLWCLHVKSNFLINNGKNLKELIKVH